MARIKLNETRFEILAPDNYHYHDDGAVRSITEHTLNLLEKYDPKGISLLSRQIRDGSLELEDLAGYCLGLWKGPYSSIEEAIRSGTEINVHLCVNQECNPNLTIMYKGHEEMHTALDFDRIDLLIKGLESIGIRSDGIGELSTEGKCDVAGIYALLLKHPKWKGLSLYAHPEDKKATEECANWFKRNSNLEIEVI